MENISVRGLGTSSEGSGNVVSRDSEGRWQIRLKDDTVLPLDERQGKELFVMMRATERIAKTNPVFSMSELDPKTLDEYIISRADCFKLVARAIVDYPLKVAVDIERTDYIQLFADEKYIEYASAKEIQEEFSQLYSQGHIVIGQIYDDASQTVMHTMIAIRGQDRAFILHKTGMIGPVFLDEFNELIFEAMKNAYGKRMAFASFDTVANSTAIKERLSNPPKKL